MEYERKMIEAAKTRLKELGAKPSVVDMSQEAHAMGAICAAASDDHINELVAEAAVRTTYHLRKTLADMFNRWPTQLGPLESVLYDYISEQLEDYVATALAELKDGDDGRRDAEQVDRQERLKDLQEEDRKFRQRNSFT